MSASILIADDEPNILVSLEFLLKRGSEACVAIAKDDLMFRLDDLARNFDHRGPDGRDHGINVRHRCALKSRASSGSADVLVYIKFARLGLPGAERARPRHQRAPQVGGLASLSPAAFADFWRPASLPQPSLIVNPVKAQIIGLRAIAAMSMVHSRAWTADSMHSIFRWTLYSTLPA